MDFAIQYSLAQVMTEFGCPKEWKGDWDRVLGMLAGVWEEACEVQDFKHIHEVVHLFQTWANEMMEKDFFLYLPSSKITTAQSKTSKRAYYLAKQVKGSS